MRSTNKTKSIMFRSIPAEFKHHEKVYVIQYEFSGIQSFIFGDVTLNSTREQIAGRSAYVQTATDNMENWLRAKCTGWDRFRVLSKSSGKLICAVSHWMKESKITAISEELQRIIYASTEGRLEMFYAVCAAKIINSEEQDAYENAMTTLAVNANKNKYHCVNTLGIDCEHYKKEEFVQKIDTRAGQHPDVAKEIRVAIKFDLDNLGSFFQKIHSFDERQAASKCLAEVLEGAFANVPDVYPLFIGGDDIFAIASLETYIQSVTHMYKNIVRGIQAHAELSTYSEVFGISGGISFIRNDLGIVPLVYYFEQSEENLTKAKSVLGKNRIAISKCMMTWDELETISDLLRQKQEKIFQGLTRQQRMNMYTNIRELKGRILSIHKNTGRKLLTREEEQHVYNIH